jgi:hypothetical protein
MEAKTLLSLIKTDIAHLEDITREFNYEPLPSREEAEVALVHANALVRELEMLCKHTKRESDIPSVFLQEDENKGKVPEIRQAPEALFDFFDIKTDEEDRILPPGPEMSTVPDGCNEQITGGAAEFTNEVTPDIAEFEDELSGDEYSRAGKTLGESLGESHQMVNDILSQEKRESAYQITPLKSIRDGIGINDRFLFIRELFENNSEKFDTAVGAIDNMDTIRNAVGYLKMNFKWHETEASQKFLILVKRRFTN